VISIDIARPRSNSFNLVAGSDVLREAGARCPLREGGPSASGDRAVYLRLRDRMRLFTTGSEDFDDAELHRTKHVHGQLYVDASTKQWPDDFARDLRKLTRSSECKSCERRADCAECWVATPDDVFSRDDARLRAWLGTLEGAVLDVGAGEGPYGECLAQRALTGAVAYTGMEPDASRVAILERRAPWGRFVVGTLESGSPALGAARFDHVLFLRSYNHLPDPRRTLRIAVERLAPGGRLTVVDNVAFGLLRSVDQARRAEGGTGVFEHFRNDSAAECAALGRELGLVVDACEEVAPHTSNQWLVRFSYPGAKSS
jgi:SAM-dependent methyltransferase